MKNTELKIIPTSEVNLDQLEVLESKLTGVQEIASKFKVAEQEKQAHDEIISNLTTQLNVIKSDSIIFDKLNK